VACPVVEVDIPALCCPAASLGGGLVLFGLDFCSAFQSCTVSAFCGCLRAGVLRKFFKLVERSLEREPLVAAGIEFGLSEAGSIDAVVYYIRVGLRLTRACVSVR
jgi:hypothetical protein